MGKVIADRHQWAMDMLAVDPFDRLLEIGCGNGTMVALICNRLTGGTITAIDRSEKMTRAAEMRNAPYISEGKAHLITASIHEADMGPSRFNKIFAVNVNLFWMKADQELAKIMERLEPEGALYLFYQPPATGKIRSIVDSTSQNLLHAGFTIQFIDIGHQQPIPVVCVIGSK